ncbi:MAG: hypothetical protein D3916_10600 [Candidatus Electrothrix sp. MAN1_4]|nr:hypothetical protein [Candidatus Electrothrix sp. MAN1_4]
MNISYKTIVSKVKFYKYSECIFIHFVPAKTDSFADRRNILIVGFGLNKAKRNLEDFLVEKPL